MPSTIKIFRDKLKINSALERRIMDGWRGSPKAVRGDTVVLGARHLTLDVRGDFLPGINLILLADTLVAAAGSEISKIGTEVKVSVFARNIGDGKEKQHLKIAVNGKDGNQGVNGDAGIMDYPFILPRIHNEKDSVNGGAGTSGETGGTINLRYLNTRKAKIELRALGGKGGKGGHGTSESNPAPPITGAWRFPPALAGKGGIGGRGGVINVCFAGARPFTDASGGDGGDHGDFGLSDTPIIEELLGEDGDDGVVNITNCEGIEAIWGAIPSIASDNLKKQWAKYRCEVGEYRFKCFDPTSLILAIEEFQAALKLDPGNERAQIQLSRILDGQTPSGLSRDLDIAPDYQSLGDLAAPIGNVIDAFLAAQVDNITADICAVARVQLEAARDRAVVDLQHAQHEVSITEEIVANTTKKITDINQKLEDLKNQPFDIFDVIRTVGAVASSIASIVSGVGAIISIPSSLVAVDKTLSDAVSLKEVLLKSSLSKDLSKLGKGFEGIGKVSTGILNIKKVIADIEAASTGNQAEAGKLLSKLAEAKWEQMIAQLRSRQAIDFAQGLQRHTAKLNSEIDAVASLIDTDLRTGTIRLLELARSMASQVSEGLFIAHRAMEIYLLNRPVIRFDYGFIHPDKEHNYLDLDDTLHSLARDSYASAAQLQQVYFSWRQVYEWLTVAQGSYDVVRPMLSLNIGVDDATRASIQSGEALGFTLDLQDIPPEIYELKIDGLEIEFVGAAASGTVMFWVLHSGHWWMERRRTEDAAEAEIVEFRLFPRREICNCSMNGSGMKGKIPITTPPVSVPGPPFSFWGRGASAEWSFYLQPEGSAPLDVANLSEVRISLLGLGFSPRPMSVPGSLTLSLPPQRIIRYQPPTFLRR